MPSHRWIHARLACFWWLNTAFDIEWRMRRLTRTATDCAKFPRLIHSSGSAKSRDSIQKIARSRCGKQHCHSVG